MTQNQTRTKRALQPCAFNDCAIVKSQSAKSAPLTFFKRALRAQTGDEKPDKYNHTTGQSGVGVRGGRWPRCSASLVPHGGGG